VSDNDGGDVERAEVVNPLDMGGLGGGLGGLLEQAQQMMAAQAQAAEQVVEGQAGGGVVRVEVTGGGEFRSVTISPEVVDPADVDMLQDLVLAALHDATSRVAELQAGALGGLDLGGLGGLLGDAGSE
jgi:DNA-binding YbaB/EbfC family protein